MHPRGVLKYIIAVFVFLDMLWYNITKTGGRIICCAQVLRDFWVDLLSLHDVNKTYLNTASFWLSGTRVFFDQNSREALRKWWCKWVWILLQDKFLTTFYCFPFLIQPYTTQAGFLLFQKRLLGFDHSLLILLPQALAPSLPSEGGIQQGKS